MKRSNTILLTIIAGHWGAAANAEHATPDALFWRTANEASDLLDAGREDEARQVIETARSRYPKQADRLLRLLQLPSK